MNGQIEQTPLATLDQETVEQRATSAVGRAQACRNNREIVSGSGPRRSLVRQVAGKVTAVAARFGRRLLKALRREFAAPHEKLVLLVGRLVYEKGFQLALDALPAVIDLLEDVRFLVAGSGTHEGELFGIPGSGKPIEWRQCHLITVADGRATAHRAIRDDLGLMRQMGAISGG